MLKQPIKFLKCVCYLTSRFVKRNDYSLRILSLQAYEYQAKKE